MYDRLANPGNWKRDFLLRKIKADGKASYLIPAYGARHLGGNASDVVSSVVDRR